MKVTFKYRPLRKEGIKEVNIAGSFNNWDRKIHPMELKDNTWQITLDLPRENYLYKFLINQEDWVHDPDGERFIQNEIGTLDSIKILKASRKSHGAFSPIHPTLNDEITIYSTKQGKLIWNINGWHEKNNETEMKKDGKLYKCSIGPFNRGTLPEVIVYKFIHKKGIIDNNEGKDYWIPIDLKIEGKTIDLSVKSRVMKEKSDFRIYLPGDYDKTKKKYPLLLLLHGYGGTSKSDWTQQNIIKKMADLYGIIILWPDGNISINGQKTPSWYINSPQIKYAVMEDFIIKELIPFMEKKFRVKKYKDSRGIAGISMGGYGAFYLGSKYSNYFRVACSLSAINNIHKYKTIEALQTLVGRGNWRSNCYDVTKLIKKVKNCDYYFIIGTEEYGAIEDNIKLEKIMERRNIPHEFHLYNGDHTNNFWRKHIQEMMTYIGSRLCEENKM